MFKLILKIIGAIFLVLVLALAGLALTLKANPPRTVFDVEIGGAGQRAGDDSSVLIFGATRNTGLMVAEQLVARGDRVTAFVRPTSDRAALEKLGVEFVVGDAMDIASVREAFVDRKVSAVLTTIGCLSCEPPPDFQGNANIFVAATEAQVSRVVFVTSIGAGNSHDAAPALSKRVLAKILPLKTQAEHELQNSGLDYTIIRPGGLRAGKRTGSGVLSEDIEAFGYIYREDLADLIVAVLDDDRAIGKTFAALDTNIDFPWSGD
jgi:uncharacterized protein YbjT (DUF2867 family)